MTRLEAVEHGSPAARSGRRRRLQAVAALAVAALVLTACGFIGGVVRTANDLSKAGFRSPDINETTVGSGGTVTVSVQPLANSAVPLPAQARQVAAIVWRDLPGRFDTLHVDFPGHGFSYSHAQLVASLGPRPGNLDTYSLGRAFRHGAIGVAIGLLLFLLVIAGVITLVVVLVRRSNRHRGPEWTPMPGAWGYGAAPGWAPGSPPPGAPGWAPGSPPPGAPGAPGWAGPPPSGQPPPGQPGWAPPATFPGPAAAPAPTSAPTPGPAPAPAPAPSSEPATPAGPPPGWVPPAAPPPGRAGPPAAPGDGDRPSG